MWAPELVGKPLASRAAYARRLSFLWCFTLVWIAAFVSLWSWFETIGGAWRGIILVLLVLTAPDVPSLFVGYERYVRTWKRVNSPRAELHDER